MNKTMEETFIDRILPSLTLYSKRVSGAHRFACPYCQSNGIDRKGKRIPAYKVTGFLYRYADTNAWNFKCHKCGEHHAFEKFLEQQFPLLHFEYVCLREQLGTTGFQTNCPSLETLLRKRGMLSGQPPDFRPERFHQHVQRPVTKPAAPSAPTAPKVTKLPPMRSPQQQAGCQASLNRQMKQREKRKRREAGDSWLR
jgi:predicted RNA-binding Zn-ribbon protein involved in translation (DUF1610 family)